MSLTVRNSFSITLLSPAITVLRTMRSSSDPAILPAKNCKWKRGRPVTFNTRRFTTQGINEHGKAQTEDPVPPTTPGACSSRQALPVLPQPGVGPLTTCSSPARLCNRKPGVGLETCNVSTRLSNEQNDHTGVPSANGALYHVDAQQNLHWNDHVHPDGPSDSLSHVRQDYGIITDNEESVENHIDLAFQIPEEDLRTAVAAPEQTRASYWSTKLYRGPKGETVSIHYCKTMDVAERVARYFLTEKVVGFDIEWKMWGNPSSIKDNASLIQLACENRIALFHVALFPGWTRRELLPPTLQFILESPDIYKVGVSIKGDFRRLQKYLGLQPQGVFELSRLHNLVEWYEIDPSKISNRLVALATQVQQHLKLPLYKGGQLLDDPNVVSSVRESDWSLPLGNDQIHYAAADAYAGFRLYDTLEVKRKRLRPVPARVGLCDGDALPRERPKTKRTVKKTQAKEDAIPEQKEEEDDDLEDDSEEYQTASEESTPSSDEPSALYREDGTDDASYAEEGLAFAADLSTPSKRTPRTRNTLRRTRVDSSMLEGPDPGYPVLPELPVDDENPLDGSKDSNSYDGNIETKILLDEVDDEYPDSELEEALRSMDLGSDGASTQPPNSEHGMSAETYDPAILVDAGEDPGVRLVSPDDNVEKSDNLCNTEATNQAESVTTPPSNILQKPELETATKWVQAYFVSTMPSPFSSSSKTSRVRATVTHLRAYHLWYHQNLSIQEITELLREPPLAQSTVIGYVLQAITMEKLDYDDERVKMLIMTLPLQLRKGRWRWIASKVGIR